MLITMRTIDSAPIASPRPDCAPGHAIGRTPTGTVCLTTAEYGDSWITVNFGPKTHSRRRSPT